MSTPTPSPNYRTGKICYIEIPAIDISQSAQFYQRAFGWRLLVSIMVASAATTIETIIAAGGEIVQPVNPDEHEVYALFRDPAGNILGIYQQPGLAEIEARR
ncbi:MAG: VOC family protein [Chloroflexi bacterium]|nr:MAG: VOC family protein [Chloroflexota bacterium]